MLFTALADPETRSDTDPQVPERKPRLLPTIQPHRRQDRTAEEEDEDEVSR